MFRKSLKKLRSYWKKIATQETAFLLMESLTILQAPFPITQCIVETAYYTGMRRKEILSLRWNKVELKNKIIKLEAKATKDNEPRTIPKEGYL